MFWTKEEDQFLYDNYSKCTKKELAKSLPNRTVNAIGVRMCQLRLCRVPQWTEQERLYLETEYLKGTPLSVIAEHVGRSESACRYQANQRLWLTRKGDKL